MIAVLVDEDLPRSLARRLRNSGLDAVDVRDIGLGSAPDARIAAYAVSQNRVLITRDVSFATQEYFRSAIGVVLVRFPSVVTTETLGIDIEGAMTVLRDEDLGACIVVLEPGRIRLRRRSAPGSRQPRGHE